jgi:hypothetical protein
MVRCKLRPPPRRPRSQATAELLLRAVRRRLAPTAALCTCLALAVLPLWIGFFAVLALNAQLDWEPELWAGSLVLVSLTGYGLGLLLTADTSTTPRSRAPLTGAPSSAT